MARFKVGDKVIITEGDFKGERGAIVDKRLLGKGLNGRTREERQGDQDRGGSRQPRRRRLR
ncbi:MAG: KOW motif-containing protein [Actinomycetota bacterium]